MLARMPRWFADHARKTEARGRRRRAAQAARFELAYAPLKTSDADERPVWPDTVAAWQGH